MKYIKKFENYDLNINNSIIDAIMSDDADLALHLTKHDSDVNEIGFVGRTPLIYCAIQNDNYFDVCNELIKRGAKLNIQDEDGNTALIFSAQMSCTRIMILLIEHNAEWFIKNKFGRTFIDYLSPKHIKEIKKSYPEKYEEYEAKKDTQKYNL